MLIYVLLSGDPETLIPGTITVPSLQKRLTKHQAGTGCTLVIGIENQSGFAWNGVSNLLIAGTAEKTLPDYVPNGKMEFKHTSSFSLITFFHN